MAPTNQMAGAEGNPSEEEDAQYLDLVGMHRTRSLKTRGSRRGPDRRLVAGAALAVGAVATTAVAWRAIRPPCVPRGTTGGLAGSLVSLSQQYPQDLVSIFDRTDDGDAVVEWLSTSGGGAAHVDPASTQSAAVQHAMNTNDPEEARVIAEGAMAEAVLKTQGKRADLKRFVEERRQTRGLRRKKGPTPAPPPPTDIKVAYCTFDILSIITTATNVAANFHDAVKTCERADVHDMFAFKHDASQIHDKVCSVNAIAVIGNLVSIAGGLSQAADRCAATIIPNIGAKCATAVLGLVTATSALAGGASLISGACSGHGWYSDIPAGLAPSNVGSNTMWEQTNPEEAAEVKAERAARAAAVAGGAGAAAAADRTDGGDGGRRLGEVIEAAPRQLLFGGGKESTATHCSMEIAGVMWNLASFAFAVNNLGNQETGVSCPPADLLGGKHVGLGYRMSQAFCTLDVTAVITAVLQIVAVFQLIVVNCADVLNLRAICGAGISGMFAGSAGVAQAATGIHLACDVIQKKPLKRLINLARGIDKKTGLITGLSKSLNLNLGRRLTDAMDGDIADLKRQFASPEEVFLSLGLDLDNSTAPFRTAPQHPPLVDEFASLVEAQQLSAAGVSLNSAMCVE